MLGKVMVHLDCGSDGAQLEVIWLKKGWDWFIGLSWLHGYSLEIVGSWSAVL